MAKGKKSRTPATITGSTGQAAGQQATAPTAVTAVADTKDSTKATSSEFQAFISDLEASPPFNPLNHASAGHGSNTLGQQEEELPVGKGEKTGATVSAKPSFAGLFSTNLGYIVGKFSGLQAIRALSKSWGASFQQHDSGWLVFRFARDDDRQRILAGGPYLFYGRPLLLKAMPDCFEFKDDDISLTPVWAILPSLPLECWHPNALGKIGSRDTRSSMNTFLSFAPNATVSGTTKAHAVITNNQPLPLPLPLLVNLQPLAGCYEEGLADRMDPSAVTIKNRAETAAHYSHRLKQKQSTTATEQKQKQSITVAEQKQQTVTDTNAADGIAHERPESSRPQTRPKGQRQSSSLRQKEAEIDSSASSCEPDSPASTQHLMPGTIAYRKLKLQLGGESPPSPITMKIGFWNVRGFNRPLKHNGVAHLIKNNQLCLLGILGTKLTTSAIARIINRSFLRWCQINNFDTIANGRILIIWNPAVIDLVPEDISPQVIHCRAKNKSSQLSFYISFTYDLYTVVHRKSMWEKLSELGRPMNMSWLIIGDFNCVKSPTEKQLGATPTWYELKDFADCCLLLGLNDAPTAGCYFTWYSNSESNPVWCKLDQVLFNNEWLEAGLLCNAHFSPPRCLFDHSPGIVSILDLPAS
ncbi:UNVERIFIED_CONTAM: hypothetical protein Sradi_4169000 [Sesamum radiatum]|uniref:DUF4283 domain-containing protein n=1 Tax=Sesamum radiatum TaxID=300843 RepID=A0AAW2P5M3_SESRA